PRTGLGSIAFAWPLHLDVHGDVDERHEFADRDVAEVDPMRALAVRGDFGHVRLVERASGPEEDGETTAADDLVRHGQALYVFAARRVTRWSITSSVGLVDHVFCGVGRSRLLWGHDLRGRRAGERDRRPEDARYRDARRRPDQCPWLGLDRDARG